MAAIPSFRSLLGAARRLLTPGRLLLGGILLCAAYAALYMVRAFCMLAR